MRRLLPLGSVRGAQSADRGPDTRVAYGIQCTWWGPIQDVGTKQSGQFSLPCCPHCSRMLFELPTEADYLAKAEEYERSKPHPGYLDMVKWARGRCFPNFATLVEAYRLRETT